MTADEWLNQCLMIESGKEVRRKDVLDIGIYRTEFLRGIFNDIQRTVRLEIPATLPGETVQHYRARVISAAMKSGGTVVADK